MASKFRKTWRSLNSQQTADLVAMRLGGALWKDVGRAFGLQDGRAKQIYERAVAVQGPATPPPLDPTI